MALISGWSRAESGKGKFCVEHVQFELSVGNSKREVEYTVGYTNLECYRNLVKRYKWRSHQYINSINVDKDEDPRQRLGVLLQCAHKAQSEGATKPILLVRNFQLSLIQ